MKNDGMKKEPTGQDALLAWEAGHAAFKKGDYDEARKLAELMCKSDREAMLKRLERVGYQGPAQ